MKRTIAVLTLALWLGSPALHAQGVAGFHPNCQTCHEPDTPSAQNAKPDVCITCHGEKPEKGRVVVNGKPLNPHQGHFDTFDCLQCHKPHSASVNGCAECHTMDPVTMPSQ